MLNSIWSILLELSPWLLLGTAISVLLHVALPRDFIHRQLSGWAGVVKAVVLGVPLPLCSCGVIPAGLGLKRDGASHGAAVGFLISTPQTGVDSVLVSAAFLGWPFALFKVASAALTGLVGGFIAEMTVKEGDEPATAAPAELSHSRRSIKEGVDHGMQVMRAIWRWLVIGVLASAALEHFLPGDFFDGLTVYGGLAAMLVVLAISVPLYVCATASVPIAAALVAAGLPPGAALVFLMAGPATNVATLGAVSRVLGRKSLIIYLLTIVIGSVGLGAAFDFLLDDTAAVHAHEHGSAAWWAVASTVVLLAWIAYFVFEDLRRLWARAMGARSHGGVRMRIGVEGMKCGGCVSKLEDALRSEEGVSFVSVALEPGVATIGGSIAKTRVLEIIRELGFVAVEEPVPDESV